MTSRIEQLKQLATVTWDGNLISKHDRDELVKCGWATRSHGYNVVTESGIQALQNLGLLSTN